VKFNRKQNGEMSIRQAERIIETYENASKNGKEWAHDVFLRRGTDKYQKTIDMLNEAFRIKSIEITVEPLESHGVLRGRRNVR
jgi:hypothetical protein